MLISRKSSLRGDTLVEVMLAVSVFGLVAVGAMSIMNQAVSTAQLSLETSMVRNEINAQAESLRFLNAAYIAAYKPGSTSYSGAAQKWKEIDQKVSTQVGSMNTESCTIKSSLAFIINPKTAKLSTSTIIRNTNVSGASNTYAQLKYDDAGNLTYSDGIWIDAVKVSPTGARSSYIDFYIRACWDGPRSNIPVTIDTVVRLYEPN